MLLLALAAMAAVALSTQRTAGAPLSGTISRAEVAHHQSPTDLWVVVDNWVLNATDFVAHHPGGTSKILGARLGGNFSFSRGKNAHFAATAAVFSQACARFGAQPPPRQPMPFTFWRSRANGGLDRDGKPEGPKPAQAVGVVTILGRLAPGADAGGQDADAAAAARWKSDDATSQRKATTGGSRPCYIFVTSSSCSSTTSSSTTGGSLQVQHDAAGTACPSTTAAQAA